MNGHARTQLAHALRRAQAACACCIRGARQHNLKSIDVAIPLQPPRVRHRRVRVRQVDAGAGRAVSGAAQALRQADRSRRARTTRIEGAEHIGAVVMVDQAPIGRTTRSNPASYVGAFDAIRKLFAAEPLAKERGYTHRHVQLQLGQRPLPDLRRQRLRARRDAVPVRRVSALPRLQWPALSRRDSRGHAESRARRPGAASPTCST